MFTRALVALFICVSFATEAHAGLWDSIKGVFSSQDKGKPPTIRVLIAHDKESAVLEVKGKYNIVDPYKNTRLGTRFMGKSNQIEPLAGGLKWGEEFPGVYQIAIIPDDTEITTLVDGIEYRGNLFVYDIGGAISIVNEVDLEDYLNSLMSMQYREQVYSPEAMAAITIVNRTDALYKARTSPNPYWHVDGNKVEYFGSAATRPSKPVERALATTRYMVLSRTGQYEGEVSPIITEGSAFSPTKAETLSQKGENAAKILAKTFPDASIRLIFLVPQTK